MSTFKADYIIARQEEIAGNTSSIPVKTVVNGTPKAWVNFNGTGTIAIRGGFNVTSLTDSGVGDNSVNLTNALLDTNYAVAGNGGWTNTSAYVYTMATDSGASLLTKTTTTQQFNMRTANGTAYDSVVLQVTFMR